MKVKELVEELELEVLNMADGDREITGGYTGDLLSWVMSRASYGDCWVTIMSNVNIVAVAALVDTACIVVCENAEIGEDVIAKAKERGVNLLYTKKDSYKICCDLHTTARV